MAIPSELRHDPLATGNRSGVHGPRVARGGDVVKVTPEQQLRFLARDVLPVLKAVTAGYDYNRPDLENDEPITVRMTLGDWRRASRLKAEVEKSC